MSFSLNEFFYNIIPGTIFLIFWIKENDIVNKYFLSTRSLIGNDTIVGILLFISALSPGLLLHGIFRTIKYYYVLNDEKKNLDEYNQNAYLWAKGFRALPDYFSIRGALWCSSIIGFVVSFFAVEKFRIYYIFFIIILYYMYKADHPKEINTIEGTYSEIKKDKDFKCLKPCG